MAIRASQQRQARLDAAVGGADAAEVAALPGVRPVSEPPELRGQRPAGIDAGGDDDTDAELDGFAADEPVCVGDDEFYADALEMLR